MRGWSSVCTATAHGSESAIDAEVASRTSRTVQWYPGHVAKAERQLREQLKVVDVVLEVRDARCPQATRHPQFEDWTGHRQRLLVLNRFDMVDEEDRLEWSQYFGDMGQRVFWTDAKTGKGVQRLVRAAASASTDINAKRKKRGLKPRPVRAVAVGFPNVGKSALINRILGRRYCDSAPRPGVTRQLRWVRVQDQLDLLDSPGILPTRLQDQDAARMLAMCNNIGTAAYSDSQVAISFVELCRALPEADAHMEALRRRYGLQSELDTCTEEDVVVEVAQSLFGGDIDRAGARILKDFRTGKFGKFSLENPPGTK